MNDGILLEQKDSELFFTVKLTAAKGGGESTLLEGKDTITVHLYNSCEGTDVNLTNLHKSASQSKKQAIFNP